MKSNNLKVLIVDDEQDARDILKYYLQEIPNIGSIEEASNTDEALFKYIDFNPDLLFLDIMMPGRNGDELIELLKRKEPGCHIIIVSAYRDKAIMAIQNNIYDFILKPVDPQILSEKVEKLQYKLESSIEEKFKKVLSTVDQGIKLKISSSNNHILIDPGDILYCEADGSYSYLVMNNGNKQLANTYLGKLEKILSAHRFYRISRSILINLDKLSHVNKNNSTCKLIGTDFEITVSGSKKQIKILCEMEIN